MHSSKVVHGSIAIILMIMILSSSGCLKNPSNGGGGYLSIPEVLIDYDYDTGCFKIYVNSALGDYKYRYIMIQVDGNQTVENNTYVLSYTCAGDSFTVTVEASVDEDTVYYSTLEVSLSEDEENNIIIYIIDRTDNAHDETDVLFEDLPWKKILVQKE